MQDIMEEKVEKGFMIINKLMKLIALSVGLLLIFASCKEENPNAFIDELPPAAPFEISVNLDLISSQSLEFQNHLYINDVGLNGIVIVKRSANNYASFERTCPYQPEEDCSRIVFEYIGTGSYLACNCGDSFYNLSGFPTNSPSPRKLREYRTDLSGNFLFINNEVVISGN